MRAPATLRGEVGAARRTALLRAGLALCAAMALAVLALLMDERAPAHMPETSPAPAIIGAGMVPDPAQSEAEEPTMPSAAAEPDGTSVAAQEAVASAAQEPVQNSAAVSPPASDLPPGVLLPLDALRPAGEGYQLQLGVFGDAANALKLYERLSATGFEVRIQSRVVLGPFPDRRAAEQAQAALRHAGEPAGVLLPPRARR